MTDENELAGLRNLIESQRTSNEARRAQMDLAWQFWGGKPPPYKFSRRTRFAWWRRDVRRRVAEWIYPESRDDWD